MSPLILAMLGRTFGPSIARDLPPQMKDLGTFLMNPTGFFADKSQLAAAKLYGDITGDYAPYEGVINMLQGKEIYSAETGDNLRRSLSEILPERLGQFVAPGERYYSLGLPDEEFGQFDSPQQTFRNYELVDQLAGAGELNPAYYGDVDTSTPTYSMPNIGASYPGGPTMEYTGASNSEIDPDNMQVVGDYSNEPLSTPDIPDVELPSVDVFGMPDLGNPPVDMPTNYDFGSFDNIDFGEYFRRGGAVKR